MVSKYLTKQELIHEIENDLTILGYKSLKIRPI